MDHPLTVTARRTVERHELLPPSAHVLVAVSGGQDSLALLRFLDGMTAALGLHLSAIHVHHGLRGRDADDDESFVAQQCAALGIACTLVRCDTRNAARLKHMSTETAARIERRSALFATADEIGADLIALGHTADDRIETVLLNIVRGSGLRGLAALPPRDGRIIRPLIEVPRAMTGDYCRSEGLTPRYDSTNSDLRSRRNRVRAELIPYLEAFHNRAVGRAVLRLADLAAEDERCLDDAAEREVAAHVVERDNGALAVDRDVLRSLHPALRRRVVRHMVRRVSGSLQDVPCDVVAAALRHAASAELVCVSWDLKVPATIRVSDCLEVLPRQAIREPVRSEYVLPVPGTILLPLSGARLTSEFTCATAVPQHLEARAVLVPERSVRPPIVARAPRPGDRLRPIGSTGRKKLGDCFTDRRMPKLERAKATVVADEEGILWVPGVVADERIRIRSVPCSCIRLTYAEAV